MSSEVTFGASILIGKEECGRTCINGLPVIPAPTRMLSRFTKIMTFEHRNLCKYLEIMRCNTALNAVILVSEHYPESLTSTLGLMTTEQIAKIMFQLLDAVNYCHQNLVIVGYLTLNSIAMDSEKSLKLSQYGFYHIGGSDVDYVIGSPWYLSPERLARSDEKYLATYKSDIWTVGIILLELSLSTMLTKIWGKKQVLSILSSLIQKTRSGSLVQPLIDAIRIASPTTNIHIDQKIFSVIERCLQILPSDRPNAEELLNLLADEHPDLNKTTKDDLLDHFPTIEEMESKIRNTKFEKQCSERPLNELFFIWKLCGSSVENILINRGIIKMKQPPVHTLPNLVINNYRLFGNEEARKLDSNFSIYTLPSNNLKNRLTSIPIEKLFYSFELEAALEKPSKNEYNKQSNFVRERDIDYQVLRMGQFNKLIRSCSFKRDLLISDSRKDIPPIYRGRSWSALLDVKERTYRDFERNDTITEQVSDRQLQVDIPRCHQYDELMTSPAAHYKLKIVLKAWLNAHPDYVYWQGLDSLTAPFLILNFNNLPMAFGSLKSFVSRYLYNFFLRDNSAIIQEYLAVFMHILAFIDSELFTHLLKLEFRPELFAIPWFLTCFAHVLPLSKLFHLWDALLLADSSFPLFIGVAILIHLRGRLINSQFNDAILLFSDLPDISIDFVVNHSKKFYQEVPPSCTHRQYSSDFLREDFTPVSSLSYNELLTFYCPRISVSDLKKMVAENRVLIIDVRPQNEYSSSSLPSLNCPFTKSSSFEMAKQAIGTALDLANHVKKHMICIVGEMENAKHLANECVVHGYDKICILNELL